MTRLIYATKFGGLPMSMVHFQVHHGAESAISFPWLGELRVISTEGETYTALAHIADQLPVVVYTGECLLIGRGGVGEGGGEPSRSDEFTQNV